MKPTAQEVRRIILKDSFGNSKGREYLDSAELKDGTIVVLYRHRDKLPGPDSRRYRYHVEDRLVVVSGGDGDGCSIITNSWFEDKQGNRSR